MTPGARVAAAAEILDAIEAGLAVEQALLRWSRASRFAGSKDRAAVRDYVFDAVRHWRSDAAIGGGTTGRARMIGRLRAAEDDPAVYFSGQGHAPTPLTEKELSAGRAPDTLPEALDVPDWIWPILQADQGPKAQTIAEAWQQRGPIGLRVNLGKGSREAAVAALAEEGVEAEPNTRAQSALRVTSGARRLRQTRAFETGLVELQDASSQAAVEALPDGARVLDYCAGGGGKALALAAQGRVVVAHDADPRRMSDIPARAARAGARVKIAENLAEEAPFDLVLCDAPCSGSGAWRRSPEGKWALTPDRLEELVSQQVQILEDSQKFVGKSGCLAYATCSVFSVENDGVVRRFCEANPKWRITKQRAWSVDELGDGFGLTLLSGT